MYKLKIIIATTKPGRKGPIVAEWVAELAKEFSEFETELVDLNAFGLPLMDEPEHPRLQKYQHEHTKRWSRLISEADAYIIVTAEYDFSFPAPIKNALDYLYLEWGHKPVGFVSYGGISGGLRCVQALKQVVTALKMMPIVEAVTLPFFTKQINEEGKFTPDDQIKQTGTAMFTELLKWTEALKPMRLPI